MNGYVLIIGRERKNANFFKPSKGYEVCPYKIARRLVDEGIVEPTDRPHYLGTVYVLSEQATMLAPPPPPRDEDEDDAPEGAEMDDLLVEIEDEEESEDEEIDPDELSDEAEDDEEEF
ncbi:MAG: hypothetical protein D6746_14515 [Bacteroidetes bacterium]|nr:MAG: hypothetical protein D6746_14515 [Bacteroidota bacterium]